MKSLQCVIVAFIPFLLSIVYASAWQHHSLVNGITIPRGSPLERRFSHARPLWSSAAPASHAHVKHESENIHANGGLKGGNAETNKKTIGGMDLLHEDNAVIALNKPAGIPVVPSPSTSAAKRQTATETDSVIERVIAHYKALSDSVTIPETLRSLSIASEGGVAQGTGSPESGMEAPLESQQTPGMDAVVHRLDQGTSGVLLLAKTAAAASSLRQQFRERRVKKMYFAVTQGRLKGPMTVTSCIGRAPTDRRKMQSACQIWSVHGAAATRIASGKLRGAITLFKPLLCNGKWSVLLASPITGRTHQIRLHLQMLKAPIIGDPLYGDASATSAFLASAVALRSEPRGRSSGGPGGHQQEPWVQRGPPPKALARAHLRPLLHAAEVCCMHPTTADTLRVRAPLPPDMQEAIGVVNPLWPTVPELAPFACGVQ